MKALHEFIRMTNASDVDGALSLFAPDAVIDDVSVGDAFVGVLGVRTYIERFFVGYHTSSALISLDQVDQCNFAARLDFTGDFGHEIGTLVIKVDDNNLIVRIDAYLE